MKKEKPVEQMTNEDKIHFISSLITRLDNFNTADGLDQDTSKELLTLLRSYLKDHYWRLLFAEDFSCRLERVNYG